LWSALQFVNPYLYHNIVSGQLGTL
jgi:hypothetical protein